MIRMRLLTSTLTNACLRPGFGPPEISAPVAVVLLVAVLLLAACGKAENPSTPAAEAEYIEQEADERTFNDWTLEEIGFDEPVSIDDISSIRIFNDRIFVSDVASRNVKRYAPSGKLEAVYGEGRGQGPGEFQHVFSFWVRGKEEVWIVDQRGQEVSRFRYDGAFVDSFHPQFPPSRVVAVGEGRLVLQMLSQPELFALLNEKGKVLKRFGTVISKPQERYTLALDAYMYPYPDGGFIWAPIYASYLFFYREDGELERRMELIDGYSFPIDKMQPNPMQMSYRDIQQPKRTLTVSVTEKEIFVNILSNDSEDENDATILDRYDRRTGQYLDSVRMPPGRGSRYLVHDGMIYGASSTPDTTLRAFRIHRSP